MATNQGLEYSAKDNSKLSFVCYIHIKRGNPLSIMGYLFFILILLNLFFIYALYTGAFCIKCQLKSVKMNDYAL